MQTELTKLLCEVADELTRSNEKYRLFASNHEGMGVLFEEVEELWAEVKREKGLDPTLRMKKEAIQVAAMAVKFCLPRNVAVADWRRGE